MWTTQNRRRYNRDKLRYPSDPTDAEGEHIEPLIPPAKRGGGKRRVNRREVVNGVMDALCPKTHLPAGGENREDVIAQDRVIASAATRRRLPYNDVVDAYDTREGLDSAS